MMKTKLHTFERKQILRKPSYKDNFCEKMTETLAFTWLKHNVKPVGLYENTS